MIGKTAAFKLNFAWSRRKTKPLELLHDYAKMLYEMLCFYCRL